MAHANNPLPLLINALSMGHTVADPSSNVDEDAPYRQLLTSSNNANMISP
jgi:hypothetical protein